MHVNQDHPQQRESSQDIETADPLGAVGREGLRSNSWGNGGQGALSRVGHDDNASETDSWPCRRRIEAETLERRALTGNFLIPT